MSSITVTVVTLPNVLSVIGAVGGICGLFSLLYARRQTRLIEEDLRNRQARDDEDRAWSIRFERVMNQILRVSPHLQVQEPGVHGLTMMYTSIFPDPVFRLAVESYLVQLDRTRTLFLPRSPRPDELRSKNLRETVEKAEFLLMDFRQKHPGAAHHL